MKDAKGNEVVVGSAVIIPCDVVEVNEETGRVTVETAFKDEHGSVNRFEVLASQVEPDAEAAKA